MPSPHVRGSALVLVSSLLPASPTMCSSCAAAPQDSGLAPLETAAPDHQTAVFDAILALYDEYNLVHIGERHWHLADYEFRLALLRYPRFAQVVDDIVIEAGNYRFQDVLDDYILELADVPETELRKVWREHVVPLGTFDGTIYGDYVRAVREVNGGLPRGERIRLIAAEPPIDWSAVDTWDEFVPYFRQRSTHTAEVIASQVLAKDRKAFIIYGGAHFYRSSNVVPVAGRLRTNIEKLDGGRVFSILALGGDEAPARAFQQAAGVVRLPYFLNVRESTLGAVRGDRFFPEAKDTLAGFTDGVLFFGTAPSRFTTMDPDAAADAAYQAELERRRAILEGRGRGGATRSR